MKSSTMITKEYSQWQSGFWSLMATQFQNAFSDNALKNLVVLLLLARVSEADANTHVALAGALFAAPFILFSMLGGWLADRFSKQKVMKWVKAAEIGIMLFAALALGSRRLLLELIAIFLMGCHSAIFGPSKYGILPEVLPLEKLSWGNGLLELLTFLGVILGTITGAFFAAFFEDQPSIAGMLLAVIAVIGWHCSKHIPKVPAANPSCPLRINPIADLWRQMRLMQCDRDLWRANWGNAGFFFIAALVQMNLVLYAKGVLSLSEAQNGFLNAALAVGIGTGSVVAGYASRGRIEYRLIPIGALLLALGAFLMGIPKVGTAVFSSALALLGFGGGLFIVPVAAVLQHRPNAETKGAVQGAASVLSFLGILAASGMQIFLTQTLQMNTGYVFWVCGAAALLCSAYVAFSRRAQLFLGQPMPLLR